jgi:hypothetical protein
MASYKLQPDDDIRKALKPCPRSKASQMGETTDYTLIKLDKIEDLVREVKHLLLDGKNTAASVAAVAPVTAMSLMDRAVGWMLSIKPILLGVKAIMQHIVGVATIWYLIKSGQPEAADPYIRWLLGM